MKRSKNTPAQFNDAAEWQAAIRTKAVQILSVFGFGDDSEFIDQFCESLGSDFVKAFLQIQKTLPIVKIDPDIQEILDYCGCDEATSRIIRQNILSSIMTGEYSDDKPTDFDIDWQTSKLAYNEIWLPIQTALWDKIREAEKLIDDSNLRDRVKTSLQKKALQQGPFVAVKRASMLLETTGDFMTNCIRSIEQTYKDAGVDLPDNWLDLEPGQLPPLPEQNGLS